jgi:uncharacterized integral membrane protein
MLNLLVVLLIAGGLALFALQNLTPVPLVILGQATVSLPLAIWILVAIAAGVATSLLIAGLYKASNSVASRRAAPRRAKPRNSVFVGRFATAERSSEPVRDSFRATPPPTEPVRRPAPPEDDWESDSSASDSWDDWDVYEEPRDRPRPSAAPASGDRVPSPRGDRATPRVPNPEPPLYDAEYRTLDPYGTVSDQVADVPYEAKAEPVYRSSPLRDVPPRAPILDDDDDDDDGPEEWEDWEGYDESSASPRTEQPSAPYTGPVDFEVKQEPKTAYRSGTVYSYSYRDAAEDSGLGKGESVYRSSEPIITPPPASDQNTTGVAPSPNESTNDDDWGLDDGDFDAPRR